jgi:hypothetical protein
VGGRAESAILRACLRKFGKTSSYRPWFLA